MVRRIAKLVLLVFLAGCFGGCAAGLNSAVVAPSADPNAPSQALINSVDPTVIATLKKSKYPIIISEGGTLRN